MPRTRRGQAGDPQGVDPAGVELKGVAAVPAADQGRVAEGPAQLGHLRLQGVPARAGGGRAPQVLDQPLGGHELPASSASRTSTSVVLPEGTESGRPSRRTSSGPSTRR